MLLPLGRMLPPDSGQKYPAFADVSGDEDKTNRMSRLMRENAVLTIIIPLVLVLVATVACVAIWALR